MQRMKILTQGVQMLQSEQTDMTGFINYPHVQMIEIINREHV